jgi:F-type H+-transporting ATPase subunit gamma
VSAEADKVELVYTKFVSLINSVPTVQTLLPLTPTGELCDLEGNCVDAADDEIFKLTTQVRRHSMRALYSFIVVVFSGR